eukprot:TRINITY_DN3770_c0_g1_i10.p1 TRINITY_DN3770_c0_g1~~TRINITY_DN3770_c0_g1_i10.p1  ORF type:complete len:240 (+),score=31.98 TRINITY_DN3770_c0_g1_i10:51-770(+)
MSNDDIIVLNVGGTKFSTTRQTLVKDPNSMLAKMFDPNSPLLPGKVQDGNYFLDRNPDRFKVVLDYLRDGEICVANEKESLPGLLIEARYFQLADMEQKVMDCIDRERGEEMQRARKIAQEVANCLQKQKSGGTDGWNLVTVNVSGRIFQADQDTLCRAPDSLLAQMVQGKVQTRRDGEGNLFLEEDASAFATLLNYLRTYPKGTYYDYSDDLPVGFATQLARKLKIIEHGQYIEIDMP